MKVKLHVKVGGTMREIAEFTLPEKHHYELIGLSVGDLRVFAEDACLAITANVDEEYKDIVQKANAGFVTPD